MGKADTKAKLLAEAMMERYRDMTSHNNAKQWQDFLQVITKEEYECVKLAMSNKGLREAAKHCGAMYHNYITSFSRLIEIADKIRKGEKVVRRKKRGANKLEGTKCVVTTTKEEAVVEALGDTKVDILVNLLVDRVLIEMADRLRVTNKAI